MNAVSMDLSVLVNGKFLNVLYLSQDNIEQLGQSSHNVIYMYFVTFIFRIR